MKRNKLLRLVVFLVTIMQFSFCIPDVHASDFENKEIQSKVDVIKEQEFFEENPTISENDTRAITKNGVRSEFAIVAAGGRAMGFNTAAGFLDHSLQDSPSNLVYGQSSSYAAQILKSTECATLVREFRETVSGESLLTKNKSGSLTLSSTKDLHLAYNKVSYLARGVNNNGKWTLTIIITDTYDFETQKWKNSMTDSNVITIINNYAAYAQNIGAIVPYDIKVTVQTTFTEYQLDNIEDNVIISS